MDFNLFGGTGDSGTPTSTESALYPTLTTTSDFSSTGIPSFTSSSATDAASKTSLGFSATSSLVASSLRRPQPSSSTAYSASIFLSSSTFSLTLKSSTTSSSSFSTTTSSTSSSTSSSTGSSTGSSSTSSSPSSSILSSLVSSLVSSSSSSSSSSAKSSSSSSSLSVTSSSFTTLSSSALRSLRSRSHASLTSMAESSDETTTSSPTSSTTSSRSSASITSSFSAHSTTYTLGDKTITSFVTAEPTASASSGDSGKLSSSPKIIGGVVGSVGGVIVLSALAVLFVYLRRRNRKTINPSPDFSENNSGDLNPFSEKFGLKMPFSSSKRSSGGGAGGALAGMDDIERQVDQRANSTANTVGEESGDFAYRGVTNSNNLDSVFRPTATNSSGTNTAAAASRFNSISRPLGTTYEDQDGYEFSQPEQDPGFEPRLGSGAGQNEATASNQAPPYPTGHSRGPSEDFAHFNPADYHLGEDNNDSTANSRFKEDI